MDLGLHRRDSALLSSASTLDFRSIRTGLAIAQAAAPTAITATQFEQAQALPDRGTALPILLLCEPGWTGAAAALRGSFDTALTITPPPPPADR